MSKPSDQMLFKVDALFGHAVEATDAGVVYQDDGTLVDRDNLRPCKGCSLPCKPGEHDPCIVNLPSTLHACCGHGLARSVRGDGVPGYVALKDGRRLSFSGEVGGERIRQAVEAANAGNELPEGFSVSNQMWWTGLTQAQIDYVNAHNREAIFRLVRKATSGQFPPDSYLEDDSMWFVGIDEEDRKGIFPLFGPMMAELVAEALANA